MKARFDIVTTNGKHVLLSALLNAPPHGVPGTATPLILQELKRCKDGLEKHFGVGNVHLSLDNYESAVFWYLVLYRTVKLAGRRTCVFDLLRSKSGIRELSSSDLGVQYDAQNNWLRLFWDEAPKGVLAGFEECPSWAEILARYERRTGEKPPLHFWRACAESSSWVIPISWLEGMRYRQEVRHGAFVYKTMTVLNLEGVEMIQLEGRGKGLFKEASLLVAKHVRFVHHYIDADIREYRNMLTLERQLGANEDPAARRMRHRDYMRRKRVLDKVACGQGENQKEDANNAWWQATREVWHITKLLRVHGFSGRVVRYMRAEMCSARYALVEEHLLEQHGFVSEVIYHRVLACLKRLEDTLADAVVPREFERWLRLKDIIAIKRR